MKKTALDFLADSGPWGITAEGYAKVVGVAARELSDIEAKAVKDWQEFQALSAREGAPMEGAHRATLRGAVAVIPVTGPIFPKANLMTAFSGATSIEQTAQDFASAEDNPQVKATVLDFETPGGAMTGINEFAALVASAKKPVYAYVRGQCASAGYYIASAADRIVIDDTAFLGSVGVVMNLAPKKADGSAEIVSSQSPDKRPDHTTEPGRAVLQGIVDDMAQVMIDKISGYRGKAPEDIAALRGGLLVGQKAIDAGLADRLGSLEGLIAELNKTHASQPRGFTMSASAPQGEDLAKFKAEHPALYQAAFAAGKQEGEAEGRKSGAQAERERIQGIEALYAPGQEALVAKLKYDGATTPAQAAMALNAAAREADAARLANLRGEAPPVLPNKLTQAAQADSAKPEGETEAKDETPIPSAQEIYAARAAAAKAA
jgi:ClpP class serine protease